jgi:hypothetical protein
MKTLMFIITLVISSFKVSSQIRNKIVNVELMGSNFIIGVNYEQRFRINSNEGLGLKVGIGGIPQNFVYWNYDAGLITLPIELNYVSGSNRGKFISGIGIISSYSTETINETELFNQNFNKGLNLCGYAKIGYRYDIKNSNIILQAYWNPLILPKEGFFLTWVGASVGFKL